MQTFAKRAQTLFFQGVRLYKTASPAVTLSFTMRIAVTMRLLQHFTRRLGTTKFRKFAVFKAKKFYISFRPVQKLQQYSKRKKLDDESMKETIERIKSLVFSIEKLKLNMAALLPKQSPEEQSQGGILAVL